MKDKRLILKTVGSNLFLKDRKLSIQGENPFEILEKQDEFPSWLAIVDAIRTFFKKTREYYHIPIIEKNKLPDNKVWRR